MGIIPKFPVRPRLSFLKYRHVAAITSLILCLGSIFIAFVPGLNLGIDFLGGTVMEVRAERPIDLSDVRSRLGGAGLGDVTIQRFGPETDVLIRVAAGVDEDQSVSVERVQNALGEGFEYRRIEFVGPTVGEELKQAGAIAVLVSLSAIMIYIWFRFEWQFSIGAGIALAHDIILTIGFFALTGLEFNLSTVAAVLTIAGYSINDTVVIYDRVRENMRRYKRTGLVELLDTSVNETLSRTIITSFTTVLAVGALAIFGGEVIRGFCLALIWGISVGTYSTIYIAVPVLLWTNIQSGRQRAALEAGEVNETAP